MKNDAELKAALCNALVVVQQRYGIRDRTWTEDVVSDGNVFTDSTTFKGTRKAVVHMDPSFEHNDLRQNSLHEAVHVLNPCDRDDISYLEEAAAVAISLDPSSHGNTDFVSWLRNKLAHDERPKHKRYYTALQYLESFNVNVFDLIKELRGSEGRSLSLQVTSTDINNIVRGHNDAAVRLCDKFYRGFEV
jgi:hypothetical protein